MLTPDGWRRRNGRRSASLAKEFSAWLQDPLLKPIHEADSAALDSLVRALVKWPLPQNVLGRSKLTYMRYQPDHARYRDDIIKQLARYAKSVCRGASSYEAFLLELRVLMDSAGKATALDVEQVVWEGRLKHPWKSNFGRAFKFAMASRAMLAGGVVLLESTWRCLYAAIREIHVLRTGAAAGPPRLNDGISASSLATRNQLTTAMTRTPTQDRGTTIRLDPRNAAVRESAKALQEIRALGMDRFELAVDKGTALMKLKGGRYSNEVLDKGGRISHKVGLSKISPSKTKVLTKAGYNVAALAFQEAQLKEIDRKLELLIGEVGRLGKHMTDRDEGALMAHMQELHEVGRNVQLGIDPIQDDRVTIDQAIREFQTQLNGAWTTLRDVHGAHEKLVRAKHKGTKPRTADVDHLYRDPKTWIRAVLIGHGITLKLEAAYRTRAVILSAIRPEALTSHEERASEVMREVNLYRATLREVLGGVGITEEDLVRWGITMTEWIPMRRTRVRAADILRGFDEQAAILRTLDLSPARPLEGRFEIRHLPEGHLEVERMSDVDMPLKKSAPKGGDLHGQG